MGDGVHAHRGCLRGVQPAAGGFIHACAGAYHAQVRQLLHYCAAQARSPSLKSGVESPVIQLRARKFGMMVTMPSAGAQGERSNLPLRQAHVKQGFISFQLL